MINQKTNYDRYIEREIKKDASLKKEIKKAEVAIDISMQLYSLRRKKGLTQKKLAELAGIKQSNIARLENAGYEGYSLNTLRKIAKALKTELNITFAYGKVSPSKKISVQQPQDIYLNEWTLNSPYTTCTEQNFVSTFIPKEKRTDLNDLEVDTKNNRERGNFIDWSFC